MGFFNDILGRRKPKPANLDALFSVPSAAITLQAGMGLVPTGDGAVCYRAATGTGFAQTQESVLELLRSTPGAPSVEVTQDGYGFTWLEVDHEPPDPEFPDIGGMCTDLHAVNTTLESAGFSSSLLCSLVPFRDRTGRSIALVYLYKQGTFYPFAPKPDAERQRDNLLEMQVRDAVASDLPIEHDLNRWLAIWGAPGL